MSKLDTMESRIEINGVWYVREDSVKDSSKPLETEHVDLAFSEECAYEISSYCFVASRLKKNETNDFYQDITITITDKRSNDPDTWEEKEWDNNSWFNGILEGNPDSILVLEGTDYLCVEGKMHFKAFLSKLQEKGWLS